MQEIEPVEDESEGKQDASGTQPLNFEAPLHFEGKEYILEKLKSLMVDTKRLEKEILDKIVALAE